jgi:hypothetical protein
MDRTYKGAGCYKPTSEDLKGKYKKYFYTEQNYLAPELNRKFELQRLIYYCLIYLINFNGVKH